mgnify:CR=1 FL=1
MDRIALMEKMRNSLDAGIKQGIFPGGAVCLLREGEEAITLARGKTGTASAEPLAAADTLYDMASLTKVMVTLPLVLLSVQDGRLSLSDPVVDYLPELGEGTDKSTKEKIKVIHLLTHSSGLAAWRPYFLRGSGQAEYVRLIADEPMLGQPGEAVVYSDLGFMLLGFLLERVWQEELPSLAKRLVFDPSGMHHTGYLPLQQPAWKECTIAPTEEGNRYEQNMALQYIVQLEATGDPRAAEWKDMLDNFGWRQGVIRGTVHDCNAYYGLQGVSGHAGLFSTLDDAARYMAIWTTADAPVRIDPILRAFSTRAQTDLLAPRRAVGWEASAPGGGLKQAAYGCTGGDLLSDCAFGHSGFTGTSIWSDPMRRATLITLTNRVHPVVSTQMNRWRRAHHNQLFSAIPPMDRL